MKRLDFIKSLGLLPAAFMLSKTVSGGVGEWLIGVDDWVKIVQQINKYDREDGNPDSYIIIDKKRRIVDRRFADNYYRMQVVDWTYKRIPLWVKQKYRENYMFVESKYWSEIESRFITKRRPSPSWNRPEFKNRTIWDAVLIGV